MSNILNFRHRPSRGQVVMTTPMVDHDLEISARTPIQEAFKVPFSKPTPNLLQDLEQALDAHRLTMLELAHKRKAFELNEAMAMQTATLALELAAYKAMLAGVPENDIYSLDETVAEALSSAMNTVAQA